MHALLSPVRHPHCNPTHFKPVDNTPPPPVCLNSLLHSFNFLSLGALFVGRACNTFPLMMLANWRRKEKVPR